MRRCKQCETPNVPKVAPNVSAKDQPKTKKEIAKARRRAERLKQQLEDTLGIHLPDLPATPALPQTPALPTPPSSAAGAQGLLDFLLAP